MRGTLRDDLSRRSLLLHYTFHRRFNRTGRRERLSGPAVQPINVALLAGEDERRNRSTGRREVDERSLRTEVIIPYVLFHRLEPPDRFTCGHVQRNKRSCIEVFGWTPQTAVIVSSGIAHRQVDISKLLISRSDIGR